MDKRELINLFERGANVPLDGVVGQDDDDPRLVRAAGAIDRASAAPALLHQLLDRDLVFSEGARDLREHTGAVGDANAQLPDRLLALGRSERAARDVEAVREQAGHSGAAIARDVDEIGDHAHRRRQRAGAATDEHL